MSIVSTDFAYGLLFRMMIAVFTLAMVIRIIIEYIKKKRKDDCFEMEDVLWTGLVYFSGSVGMTTAYFFTVIFIPWMWEFVLLCALMITLPIAVLVACKNFGYKMFVSMCLIVILTHVIGFAILMGGSFIVWM